MPQIFMSQAMELVAKERVRQQVEENYSHAHDDEHTEGQLALLAAAYALSSSGHEGLLEPILHTLELYHWDRACFKPKTPVQDLTRLIALGLAELERRLRVKEKEECSGPCSACQTETTYAGEHNGDYPVWLCPDHGGEPTTSPTEPLVV